MDDFRPDLHFVRPVDGDADLDVLRFGHVELGQFDAVFRLDDDADFAQGHQRVEFLQLPGDVGIHDDGKREALLQLARRQRGERRALDAVDQVQSLQNCLDLSLGGEIVSLRR